MKIKPLSRLLTLFLSLLTVLSLTACGAKKEAPANVVGDVVFTVDEAKVDIHGNTTKGLGGARVESNKFKLVPGRINTKDTTIHMDAKSADAWLFVKLDYGMEAVEMSGGDYVTVVDQLAANGWTLLQDNIYYYNNVAKASDKVVIMNCFGIREDATEDELSGLTSPELTVYAVAAEGLDSAEGAWQSAGF